MSSSENNLNVQSTQPASKLSANDNVNLNKGIFLMAKIPKITT